MYMFINKLGDKKCTITKKRKIKISLLYVYILYYVTVCTFLHNARNCITHKIAIVYQYFLLSQSHGIMNKF